MRAPVHILYVCTVNDFPSECNAERPGGQHARQGGHVHAFPDQAALVLGSVQGEGRRGIDMAVIRLDEVLVKRKAKALPDYGAMFPGGVFTGLHHGGAWPCGAHQIRKADIAGICLRRVLQSSQVPALLCLLKHKHHFFHLHRDMAQAVQIARGTCGVAAAGTGWRVAWNLFTAHQSGRNQTCNAEVF